MTFFTWTWDKISQMNANYKRPIYFWLVYWFLSVF